MNFDQFRIVAITISLSTLVHGQLVILWIWYQLVSNDSAFWKLSQESFTQLQPIISSLQKLQSDCRKFTIKSRSGEKITYEEIKAQEIKYGENCD